MESISEKLKAALSLEIPYPERLPLREGTPAAVLALFGVNRKGEPHLLMTRRTETVETHKGQMAFPGGVCTLGESCEEAALRETFEEVGVLPRHVQVLGILDELSTPSGFTITPVVGVIDSPIEEVDFLLNADEIAEAFWIPLRVLLGAGCYRREMLSVAGKQYPIHVYQVGPHRIWGATGAMIKNVLDRLAALG
jgi:8-oxo-dGTP pyrophosphatase MutT (NUDIX family)